MAKESLAKLFSSANLTGGDLAGSNVSWGTYKAQLAAMQNSQQAFWKGMNPHPVSATEWALQKKALATQPPVEAELLRSAKVVVEWYLANGGPTDPTGVDALEYLRDAVVQATGNPALNAGDKLEVKIEALDPIHWKCWCGDTGCDGVCHKVVKSDVDPVNQTVTFTYEPFPTADDEIPF